ncbi:MAG TPA: hypothetical protein VMX97_17305 [Hyphomicrobiaceae bacterium]|nr:hypothetical protein [Hyphomicrobiaceae bacterium]
MLTVVSFKWFDPGFAHNSLFIYTADYVNRWASMVSRHLSLPHELVCCTDDPEGIDPRVRIVPLPDAMKAWPLGQMQKLFVFHPEAGEIFGQRILLMDLDCVILRSIDPLVDRAEPFVAWEPRIYHLRGGDYSRYNTSFVLMDAGSRSQVWTQFDPHHARAELTAAGLPSADEQSWVTHVLGKEEPVWPWDGEIRSLKATPRPQDARIVFFNGPRSPGMPAVQAEYPWISGHWR